MSGKEFNKAFELYDQVSHQKVSKSYMLIENHFLNKEKIGV